MEIQRQVTKTSMENTTFYWDGNLEITKDLKNCKDRIANAKYKS